MYQDKKKPPKNGGLIGFYKPIKDKKPLKEKKTRPSGDCHPQQPPVASCHPRNGKPLNTLKAVKERVVFFQKSTEKISTLKSLTALFLAVWFRGRKSDPERISFSLSFGSLVYRQKTL